MDNDRRAAQDTLVRRAVYDGFAAHGTAPARRDVVSRTGLSDQEIADSFARLHEAHVLVLDARGEVLMAMPFSAVATPFRVTAGPVTWWANCAWDALGIAAATRSNVEIATDCPDCGAPLALAVRGGALAGATGVAHFAVAAAHWWDDIVYT